MFEELGEMDPVEFFHWAGTTGYPRIKPNTMKHLLVTMLAAFLIMPLAHSEQQDSAAAPTPITGKCEEGCDCERCKKKADGKELLAGKCKEGCDCEKCEKKSGDAELLAGKCKEGCDCEKCEKKSGDAELLAGNCKENCDCEKCEKKAKGGELLAA